MTKRTSHSVNSLQETNVDIRVVVISMQRWSGEESSRRQVKQHVSPVLLNNTAITALKTIIIYFSTYCIFKAN